MTAATTFNSITISPAILPAPAAAPLPEIKDKFFLNNALVDQKNKLLERINRAEDADMLIGCLVDIEFVKAVWESCGYGYKVTELFRRLSGRAAELRKAAGEVLAGMRKNAKGRAAWEREFSRLENF